MIAADDANVGLTETEFAVVESLAAAWDDWPVIARRPHLLAFNVAMSVGNMLCG